MLDIFICKPNNNENIRWLNYKRLFSILYCKIPLVDPPPITRVLPFAELIWVGEKHKKSTALEMCVNMTGVYTSFLKHLYYGMWKKLKSQKFLLLQYLWCYWSKIDNFHFSTVCTMIPNNLWKSFPDRTGHVTYRKLNHVWEHLNKWLLQRISLLFLQRIPDIQTIPNKSQVWPWIVKKGSHGSARKLADTWQCLTVGCRWLIHDKQNGIRGKSVSFLYFFLI